MSVRVFFDILNQKGTPAMYTASFSERPPFGYNGRLFIATDTRQIYEDMGDRWELIADAGAGSGNLQSVTSNGNYTSTDIDMLSGNLIYRKLSPGSVLFLNSSDIVTEDNTNFFWDDTLNRLGIGTNTPTATFDVHSADNVIQQLNATSTNNSLLSFLNQGTGKWRIGNFYNSANNDFYIFDVFSGVPRLYITNTGYTIIPTNVIIGSSNRSSAYGLDSYVSANFQSTLRVQGASTFLSQINGTFGVFSGDLSGLNGYFSGKVGIGASTTPVYNLEVSSTGGSQRIRVGTLQNNDNTPKFEAITSNGTTIGNSAWLKVNDGAGFTLGSSQYTKTGGDSGNFANLSAEVETISIFVSTSNNVLIGTTTDNGAKLQVSGNATIGNSINISQIDNSKCAIGSYVNQDGSAVNLSTLFPYITFTSNFIGITMTITGTNASGTSQIWTYNACRVNTGTTFAVGLVNSTGSMGGTPTISFSGTNSAPILTLSGYSYFSVFFQIIIR
jgi:hypothetical protein